MQRRLMLAMVGIALLSIILVGAGVLLLAQIGSRQEAREDVSQQLDALDDLAADGFSPERLDQTLRRIGAAFSTGDVILAGISAEGDVAVITGNRPSPTELGLDSEQLAELTGGDQILLDDGRAVVGLRRVEFDSRRGPRADRLNAILVRQDVATIGRRAQLWFLVSAGVVLAASVVAANVMASRFIRPIRQIQTTTKQIAAGDLRARVEVSGDDELAQLGTSVNQMTEELDRSRSAEQEFLLSISHDLRTPLTAITGYAEALTDGATEDPVRAGEVISSNAKRLGRLVQDLLDLAQLTTRRFRFELAAVDVSALVADAVAGQQPRADEYGLQLTVGSTQPVAVVADAQRVAQAIGNLIDNALKFAEHSIIVDIEQRDDVVDVVVTDDGPGIPVADLPFVFERLYVTKLKPRRAENSSGLGLAIVRELVEGMGGQVAASGGQRGGTTMVITLPVADPVKGRP